MKKIILFILGSVSLCTLSAQEPLKFGLNCIYNDSSFNELLSSRNKKTVDVIQNYNIQFLRFPGGIVSRSYFWDRQDLIPDALKLYGKFIANFDRQYDDPTTKNKRAGYYDNMADKVESALLGDSVYSDFLQFSKKNNITPIIVMNTWYYHENNKVYSIVDENNATISNSKWNAILGNIKAQVQYTHKFVNTVYWEIGNEDHHMLPAETYANITAKYVTVIKALYPNDKIIIVYADNPKSKKIESNWNDNVINCLAKSKVIDKIDFVAPHYYRAFEDIIKSQADIINRVNDIELYSKYQMLQSPIANYPNIKLFYTEFGVFKKVFHPNYNTQMHGMFMLLYLMNFNATPNVYGVIQHTFTTKTNGMFFDAGNFKALNYGFTPTDGQSNSFFVYAPPQAKAVKIFYANNPVKAQSLTINNNYAYTITNTADKIILNMLNFTEQPIKLKLNDLVDFNSSKKTAVNQYMFNDLSSKQWDYVNNSTSSILSNGTVDLKKNSYSVVTIQK